MSLTTDVIDRLAELGDSAEQIADRLYNLGITGNCEDPTGCPIFNYLSGEGFGVRSVGDDEIDVDSMSIDPPPQITAFIRGFDQGEFPELDNEAAVPL